MPRVKLIKLHGDTLGKLIIGSKDLMRFEEPLEKQVQRIVKDNGLWVIGYGLKELRFYKLLDDSHAIIVNPEPIKDSDLHQIGGGARQISGEDGYFDKFVECLCYELLGDKYRRMTREVRSEKACIISVLPTEAYRKRVDQIREEINRWLRSSSFDDERIIELVRLMLRRIKEKWRAEEVCLVFVRDPSAPGGTEIQRLIESDASLKNLVSGMAFQWVEISNRYGGERRVTGWYAPDDQKNLKEFPAVVLVDSVSFTGHTLELARDYLSKKGNRKKTDFSAALLLLPTEAKERLKSETSSHDPWCPVISPESEYSGFEVTFPWGWTTATLPVVKKKRAGDEYFVPQDTFSYIPKPWGDQLTFCSNERVSVSLLALHRGERTSTHFHLLRNETFYVLDNRIRICIWHHYIELRKHQSIFVPAGVPHSLIALDQPCRVLEIATGYHDQGRDIVRLVDIYGRELSPDGSDDGYR